MELSISISDKELLFLERIARELKGFRHKDSSLEEAVHECIRMAMYDESEEKV